MKLLVLGRSAGLELRRLGWLRHCERACLSPVFFERFHGPTPESAYRRGRALKALGRRDEAGSAFEEVATLAKQSAKYQKKDSAGWVMRAWFARLG